MMFLNQILIQLHEANRYASAENPHFRRLAVVLLDNTIELQLRRKAEFLFFSDFTNWITGVRKYDARVRRDVFRYYPRLTNLALSEGWITEDDVRLLNYSHRVRNCFYHEGGYDSLDAEMAIRFLYRFIKSHVPQWRSSGLTMLSSRDPYNIAAASDEPTGTAPLLISPEPGDADPWEVTTEEYWQKAIDHVLTYQGSGDVRELIEKKIISLIDEIESKLDFVECDGEGLDFNAVLSHRFSVLSDVFFREELAGRKISHNAALNIYLASLDEEERLLDIPDAAARAKEFHRILNDHQFQKCPLTRQQLNGYRSEANAIASHTEADGIEGFLRIEERLHSVRRALSELASDLDGYNQLCIDLARGK